MLHLKNFKEYTRESLDGHYENAIFLKDDSGEDWYDVLPKFQEDSWKVLYDSNKNVLLVKKDVSTVNPNTFSILETDTLPDNFSLTSLGKYQVVDDKVVQVISDLDEKANIIRAQRDKKLSELDSIVSNPIRYASFSDAFKEALKAYRQALLDITTQMGFPTSVTWPVMPTQ